ncbi:MAG: CPBP family intramembrane glutamic endopeptidase [Myxococcota bacterium]
MVDPVTGVVAACAVAVLVVFQGLESPGTVDRLGGGFRGKARAKALGGAVFAAATVAAGLLAKVPLSGWGVHLTDPAHAALYALACIVVFVPVVGYSSTRPSAWSRTPELRESRYTTGDLVTLVAAWVTYLFGYELFFRGILTFQLVEALGTERGLAVMTGLYVLAHLTKRPAEAASTLVVGPLFGWIALQSGGFWPVFAVHVAMALTAEIVAAVSNPEIQVGGRDAS